MIVRPIGAMCNFPFLLLIMPFLEVNGVSEEGMWQYVRRGRVRVIMVLHGHDLCSGVLTSTFNQPVHVLSSHELCHLPL